MISSMTGFAEIAHQADGIAYAVEIRTVNNRYLKTNVRLPDVAAFLADDIEKILRSKVYRGTVNYSLRMQSVSAQTLFDLDENALTAYVQKLKSLAEAHNIDTHINLADLLVLPGVILPATPDEKFAEIIKITVIELTQKAVDALKEMRAQEGEMLAKELLDNASVIEQNLKKITERAPLVVAEYHQKLRKRADELLADAQLKINEELLAREVAVYAERIDIAEELARLNAHLHQFDEICNSDGNADKHQEGVQ